MLSPPGRALCLCPRQRGQSRDGRPPAVLLARRRRAVGGQICLAWTAICESPVTGPTCQIKPTPVWRGRAAGIWKSPLSDPCHQLSEPLTSALWELPLHLVHSDAAGPLDLGSPLLLSLLRGERKSFLVLKTGARRAKSLTEFRKIYFLMVILSPRSTFYSGNAFSSSELLTFYALDLWDMCQAVNLLPFAFVSTLQTAGKNTFFSMNAHFLAVLKQIFEQLLFLLIAIVWCFKKNQGFIFP